MPKHAPSFKHLVGASSETRRVRHERTVNEILAASRAAGPGSVAAREFPPHLRERAWTPAPGTGVASAIEIDDGGIHPAELLRREQAAHLSSARSVAGPAPPRSWRRPKVEVVETTPVREATAKDLHAAAAFLGHAAPRRGRGAASLLDTSLGLVLRLLSDTTVYEDEDSDGPLTYGDVVLAACTELEPRLRAALVDMAGALPPGDARRLGDTQLRVLLEYSLTLRAPGGNDEDDWDADDVPTGSAAIHHLALTAHPAPHALLRDIPRLRALTLTSLDLTFSTVDLDRLATALPPGLRVLGLAGIRVRNPSEHDVRALGMLGRRLIVLQTLDISFLPMAPETAVDALVGGNGQLPSLRRLGLRGVEPAQRRAIKGAVNRRGRKWVDVVFE